MDILLGSVLQYDRETSGTLSFQFGDHETGEVEADAIEHLSPSGYVGIPSKPNASGSSQGLCLEHGHSRYLLGVQEHRTAGVYGSLSYGEVAVFALGPEAAGQGRILMKDNGTISTISLITKSGNTSSGNGVMIQIASDEKITITNGSKGQIFQMDSDGNIIISNKEGTGTITVQEDGDVSIVGGSVFIQSPQSQLGGSVPVALATLVKQELQKISAALSALSSPSGPVTGNSYVAPGDVASGTLYGG
jgi:hypothetical protein